MTTTNYFTAFHLLFAVLILTACGGGGGDDGPADTGTSLSVPTNVTATAGDAEVTVSWNPVSGATGYIIYGNEGSYVSSTNSSYHSIRITEATSPHTIAGLTNGQTHSFIVTAMFTSGESQSSTTVQAKPLGDPPNVVSDVSAIAANHQVTLSWSPVPTATGYIVYWSTTPEVSSEQKAGTAFLSSTITSKVYGNLINGTTYYFVVIAENESGYSALSLEASATPDLQPGWNIPEAASDLIFGPNLKLGDAAMTANRDILISYYYDSGIAQGSKVYANTYTKQDGWNTQTTLTNNGFKPASDFNEYREGIVVWHEFISSNETINVYAIKASHYQDGSWSTPVTLSDTEGSNYVTSTNVAIDPNGNAVVVWRAGPIWASTYNKAANTWSTPFQLSPPMVIDVTPRVDVDGSGLFTIVWTQPSGASLTDATEAYARQFSLANGWSDAAVHLSKTPTVDYETNRNIITKASHNGDVFVVWIHSVPYGGGHELVARKYSNGIWSEPLIIDTSPQPINFRTIAVDDNGNAVFHWDTTTTSPFQQRDRFVVYEAHSTHFGAIEEMAASTYDTAVDRVGLTVVTNGAPHMVFKYRGGEYSAAMYERIYDYATQSWSEPLMVHRYFSTSTYLAASNDTGEIAVFREFSWFNQSISKTESTIESTFYIPVP